MIVGIKRGIITYKTTNKISALQNVSKSITNKLGKTKLNERKMG
jgi:hypothetical protein